MSDASTPTAELRAGIGAGVSRRFRGYLYVFAAATLFGFGGAFARFLFYNGVTPEQLTQVRLLTATAGLWLGVGCWGAGDGGVAR